MGKIIGYARVSTTEQNLDLQIIEEEGLIPMHDISIINQSLQAPPLMKQAAQTLKAHLAVLDPGAM